MFLYLASTLFTLGMISMLVWFSFPRAVLSPADYDTYARMTSAVSIYFGVSYSLVVPGIYLPVALVLNRQIAEAKEGIAPTPEEAAGRTPYDLLRQIEAALSLLAPIITSLIASFGASAFSIP